MTDQVQGYTFQYAYSNEIIQAFANVVQPAYPIAYNSNLNNLYIENLNSFRDNTTGNSNFAMGLYALESNSTGSYNIAIGENALPDNSTGSYNIAIGENALFDNTTGSYNIAIGDSALNNNNGNSNIAIGFEALLTNSSGYYNIAIGENALGNNSTGVDNIAIGYAALQDVSTGTDNIGIGYSALQTNTGSYNLGIGSYAGNSGVGNLTGSYNTGIGYASLGSTANSNGNVAVGSMALGSSATYNYCVGVGYLALSNNDGNYNIGIGYQAGIYINSSTQNNNICIGNIQYSTISPLNQGEKENNELLIAPNVALIGGIDNNTFDTTTNKIVPSTSSYVIIYGELATSFGGTAPTSITAGASPYTFTPSSTTNQIVIISGGSVSSIALNGTTTGLTSGTFYCRAGDSLTITYTTAPTILQYNV